MNHLLENFQRKAANLRAWIVIVLVILFVVGWHVGALLSRPSHMMEMANEVGGSGRLIGNPAATDDGSRVSFFRGIESGGGLFVCDLASGKQQLLYHDPNMEGTIPHPQFGWSPDGKLVAFHGRRNGKDALLVCNVDTGQIEMSVFGWIQEFAWLSPTSFVFVNGQLMRADKHPDSIWGRPYRFTKAVKGETKYPPIRNIMADSPDSIAWTGRNTIWQWKFHADAPLKLRDIPTNEIISCCYSKDNGSFLLHLRNTNGDHLASYTPSTGQFLNLDKINSHAVNVLWLNHGKGYAYLLNESGLHSIFIKADCADEHSIHSMPQDGARTFAVGDHCVYAFSTLEGQPEGVVEYDGLSGSADYVANSQPHFLYAKSVIPSTGTITNSLGQIHAYDIWKPVHFDPRKKYPLILSQQIHVWNEYAEAAANAGAYYVSVERPEFADPQVNQWPEDVMAAYQLMSKNPNIDTNNVYLWGASAETGYVAELLNEQPTLWKGAILTSAVAFPDLTQTKVSKILINCGDKDEYHTFGGIKRFQEEAAKTGIPVTVAVLHTGHVFVSAAANRKSTEDFVEFLFE